VIVACQVMNPSSILGGHMGTIPPKKGQLQAIIPRRTTRTGKLAELSKDEDPIPGLTNDLTTRIFIEGHSGWQCTPPGCLVACVSVNSQGEVSQTFRVITSAPLRSQPHQSGYSGFRMEGPSSPPTLLPPPPRRC
jgi:hypothetical protein